MAELPVMMAINEPVLAEMGRMVFAHILTAQQEVQYLSGAAAGLGADNRFVS